MNRRSFIQKTGLIAAGTSLVPSFLYGGTSGDTFEGKRLVVIQLSGGNDGLNTFIPYEDDVYYRARPRLGIKKHELLKLTDLMGLNPNMIGFKELFDNGELAVINNVGYPNPIKSHFRSRDIWHMADNEVIRSSGWLGRYLDSECMNGDVKQHLALELDDSLTLALRGEHINGISMRTPASFIKSFKGSDFSNLINNTALVNEMNDSLGFMYKSIVNAQSSVDYLDEKYKLSLGSDTYPNYKFGQNMRDVSRLIQSGIETKAYYVTMGRYDTHSAQKSRQGVQLRKLSETLKIFVDDLKKQGTFNDTLIMVFSEFGRRVEENSSNGTDHGAANNMMLIGNRLKKNGIVNEMPDLKNLVEGDLQHTVDFRSIYQEILSKWLKNGHDIVSGNHEQLGVL